MLVGKLQETRPLERPRRKYLDNIKTESAWWGGGVVDWIHMVEVRDRGRAVGNTETNHRVTQKAKY
jgi:hypothetical protein